MNIKDNWDDNPPKKSWLNNMVQMSRKKFFLTNGIYGTIGFLCYYIFIS